MNGDESSEESSSSCCSKRHGLSRVRRIRADGVNRSDVELMIEMRPFITAPHEIEVWGKYGEVLDAEVTESLLRTIQVTHKLKRLTLHDINVTSSPAVEFINNLFKKAPNLVRLDMSDNALLGAGVDRLIKLLSCAPHLKTLGLLDVKMTPQQVMNLSSAIKQHGNITILRSSYHDYFGNLKPEHEWPSEDFWKKKYPSLFSHSSNESQTQKQQEMWPQTEIQDLHQLERLSLKERDTRPIAQDVPSLDPIPLHSAGATIRTQTGYLLQRGMQDPPQQRVQPQNTMQCDLNREGSAVTYPQGISRFLRPEKISGNSTRPRPRQPQPQSASPRNPHRGGQKSSVSQLPEISGNSTRPRLHQPQPQSASPRDPHLGGQMSSVPQLPEISGNSTRPRPRQPQPQSGSPHDPHLGGKPSDSNTPRHLSRPRHKSSKSKPRHSSNSSNQTHTEAEGRARRLQVRNKPRKGKKK